MRFAASNGFHEVLRGRVDAFFRATGRRPRDSGQMYVKTLVLFVVFAGTYGLLLAGDRAWWQAGSLAALLGLVAAGIGFNVQHDGGHQAYSGHAWINRLMAKTLDVMGGSSYVWNHKHATLHHTYVNITGHDTDVDLGVLARLTPDQRWVPAHRWQHVYLWGLYGLLAIKWHFLSDFLNVAKGRIGGRPLARPTGWPLVGFVGGKAVFFMLAFGIPLSVHPPAAVLACYGIAALVLGITMSVVFQLAHCVEEAEFVRPRSAPDRVENAWAIHQVEATVNFGRGNRVMTWLLGGLNFQIEHHLFPRVCHVHYPALSRIVEETCREFGVRYAEHPSFGAGLRSHLRWLRRMGRPGPGASAERTAARRAAGLHR